MRLYHGTVIAFANAIINGQIDVRKNENSELDFGTGFYFGDKETADRLALHKAKDMERAGNTDEYIIPCTLALDVDIEALRKGRYLKFDEKKSAWLKFVFTTRFSHEEAPYDFIEGPMADGAVDTIMGVYRKFPCFLTKGIVYFNFLRSEGEGHLQYVVKNQEICLQTITVKGIVPFGKEDDYE